MPNPAKWLTVAQASEKTGIPGRTLRHHISTGDLAAHKLGGSTGAWVIELDDLDRYLDWRAAS